MKQLVQAVLRILFKRSVGTADGQGLSLLGALASLRSALIGIAAFSGMINLLALTGSLFMLQVYDRILPSQSMPTLVALAVIVVVLFMVQAGLDIVRSRLLVRVASHVDETLGDRIYRTVLRLPLQRVAAGDGLQPLRDLDTVRGFIAGPGPSALFDLPWIPIYLAFVYLLHPMLGLLATGGAILLLILAALTDFLSRSSSETAAIEEQRRRGLSAEGVRNAEVLHSMGFTGRIVSRWAEASGAHRAAHQGAADVSGGLGAVARAARNILQSAILGLGAYLVIKGQVSGGAIIASSITSSRALAPIDQAIAHWRSFVAARQSGGRLEALLTAPIAAAQMRPLKLPPPEKELSVEALSATAPGLTQPLIQHVSFKLEAGQGLGVIGQSATGKSTLLRALVGAWPILRGNVRLDGAALERWDPTELGRHIGHLPQDVELFDGTVAENIARFQPNAASADILEAAQAASVHEMVLRLPDGYETRIGRAGMALSSGQRQRIGLARAFFGRPFLLALDEPSANLDADGEQALTRAIAAVLDRGGIVVVVTHRPGAVAAVDTVAVMSDGRLQYIGPKAEVLRKTLQPASPQPAPEPVPFRSRGGRRDRRQS